MPSGSVALLGSRASRASEVFALRDIKSGVHEAVAYSSKAKDELSLFFRYL